MTGRQHIMKERVVLCCLRICQFEDRQRHLLPGAPSRIESCLLEETIAEIADLVVTLAATANALLHPQSEEGLADLMRKA
jgi:hypothetical protein